MLQFFQYLLSLTNFDVIAEPATIQVAEVEDTEYIKVKNKPFGINISNPRRFRGTTIVLRKPAVAEYPFPAKIDLASSNEIVVTWSDLLGYQHRATLDDNDEIKIESLRDRSPEAAQQREAQRIENLRQQIAMHEAEKKKREHRHRLNAKQLSSELTRTGVTNTLRNNQVFFCDGVYLIDYSPESNEFEMVNAKGNYINKFPADERGFARLVKLAKRLRDSYNPEEHVDTLIRLSVKPQKIKYMGD